MIGLSSKLERPSVDEGVSSAAKAGTQVEQTDGWSHGLGDNRGNAGGLRVFFFFFCCGGSLGFVYISDSVRVQMVPMEERDGKQ